jgi:hypothetical protein
MVALEKQNIESISTLKHLLFRDLLSSPKLLGLWWSQMFQKTVTLLYLSLNGFEPLLPITFFTLEFKFTVYPMNQDLDNILAHQFY